MCAQKKQENNKNKIEIINHIRSLPFGAQRRLDRINCSIESIVPSSTASIAIILDRSQPSQAKFSDLIRSYLFVSFFVFQTIIISIRRFTRSISFFLRWRSVSLRKSQAKISVSAELINQTVLLL